MARMKVTITDDGSGPGGRVVIVVEERGFPSSPVGFAELETATEGRVYFRELGATKFSEVQRTLTSWIREESVGYLDPADLVVGTEVEIKKMARIRVKNSKK